MTNRAHPSKSANAPAAPLDLPSWEEYERAKKGLPKPQICHPSKPDYLAKCSGLAFHNIPDMNPESKCVWCQKTVASILGSNFGVKEAHSIWRRMIWEKTTLENWRLGLLTNSMLALGIILGKWWL